MNARVLLLFLVCALFMAAWNGDQRAMQQAYARQEAVRNTMLASRPERSSPNLLVQTSAASALGSVQRVDRSLVDAVPRPPGIAPGRYRAVNGAGDTTELTIGSPRTRSSDDVATHDFYVADDESGNRWYLIRIAGRMSR